MSYVYSGAFYPIYDRLDTGSGSSQVGYRMIFDASRVVPTANENRPANMAVRHLVKALK